MWNRPEYGSCPKPNPMVGENVEGFQYGSAEFGTVHNVECGIFQDMEVKPPPTGENVEAELSIL